MDKRKWVRWDKPEDHDRVRRRFVARYGYEPETIEEREIFGKVYTVAGPVKEGH